MNPKQLNLQMRLQRQRTNHILHLLLSVITGGLWVPVWLIVTLINAINRSFTESELRKYETNQH